MSESRQKTHGVVYTPRWLVDLILDESGFTGASGKILDPACGDGAFLRAAVERIVKNGGKRGAALRRILEADVCGVDLDRAAIAKCAEALSQIAAQAGVSDVKWNLRRVDCLARDNAEATREQFDFVVGNPPYVRIQNLGETRRRTLQRDWRFCANGSTDLYLAFFELGLRALKSGGRLGFITPNTWLKTQAARAMRRHFRADKIVVSIIDFEHWQLFAGATTYSLIAVLQKGSPRESFALTKGDAQGRLRRLGETAIAEMDDENWILAAPDERRKLRELRRGRAPLESIADIHVGITTLADRFYIFRAPRFENETALIRHPLTGDEARVERALLSPIVKASTLKSATDEQGLYVLFPYRKNGDARRRLIGEDELAADYPLAHRYFRSVKPALDARDKGRPNPAGWHAFGRSQGIDTSFGEKILTSPMNLRPRFVVWEKPGYTFYSGYCVKFRGDLRRLARHLNSDEMAFYIGAVSRRYQNEYKSFAKSFLRGFPIPASDLTAANRI